MGSARTHYCRCGSAAPLPDCVVHAMADQKAFLQRQFPSRWVSGVPDVDLPLFPGLDGMAPSKADFVRAFQDAALRMGCSIVSPDGSRAVTGHSLRVGGAQGLARRGVELWSIQLLGRWGGETVRRYLAEAHLEVASRRAAAGDAGLVGLDLEGLLDKIRSREVRPEAIRCPLARAHLQQETTLADSIAESAAGSSPQLWVTNLASGVAHKVLVRASPACALDITHCGWRFGGHRDASTPVDREPAVHRQVCARCDPILRANLKRAR